VGASFHRALLGRVINLLGGCSVVMREEERHMSRSMPRFWAISALTIGLTANASALAATSSARIPSLRSAQNPSTCLDRDDDDSSDDSGSQDPGPGVAEA